MVEVVHSLRALVETQRPKMLLFLLQGRALKLDNPLALSMLKENLGDVKENKLSSNGKSQHAKELKIAQQVHNNQDKQKASNDVRDASNPSAHDGKDKRNLHPINNNSASIRN